MPFRAAERPNSRTALIDRNHRWKNGTAKETIGVDGLAIAMLVELSRAPQPAAQRGRVDGVACSAAVRWARSPGATRWSSP